MPAEEMEVQLMILTSHFKLSKSKYLKTTQFHQIIKLCDLGEKQTKVKRSKLKVPSKTTDLICLINGYAFYVSGMAFHAFPYMNRFEWADLISSKTSLQ